jgi:hypothetical protein
MKRNLSLPLILALSFSTITWAQSEKPKHLPFRAIATEAEIHEVKVLDLSKNTSQANQELLLKNIENYSQAFGQGMANANVKWETIANEYSNLTYRYAKANQNCETKFGIFNYCHASYEPALEITHSLVNIQNKQNELITIVNNSKNIILNGTAFYIQDDENNSYIIDTRFPIQANPVYKKLGIEKDAQVFTSAY